MTSKPHRGGGLLEGTDGGVHSSGVDSSPTHCHAVSPGPSLPPPPWRSPAQWLSVKYAFVFLALTAPSQEHLVPLGRGDQLVPQCIHRPGGGWGWLRPWQREGSRSREFAQGSPEGTDLQVLVLPSEACSLTLAHWVLKPDSFVQLGMFV